MTWREQAAEAIQAAHEALPKDVSFEDRKKAIDAVYPFVERKHYPYKMWLEERRKYLTQYDNRIPAPLLEKPLSPLERLYERAMR